MEQQALRTYAFHVGDTKVPYRQFYAGDSDGWKGIIGFLTDKSQYITVPIQVFLVEHPTRGLVLIDAGINRDQAEAHSRYYDRWLLRITLDEDEYRLPPDLELADHLEGIGYSPEDIETVVLTHLHEDHLGELRILQNAEIVISEESWDAKHLGMFSLRKWSPSFRGAEGRTRRVDFDNGPTHGFSASHDLFGDESIRLLPTPGHAEGHLSVLVDMGDYHLLVTGDTVYTLRHMATDQVEAISLGKQMRDRQMESIHQIQALRRHLPDTVILPSHDHTAYQSSLIEPFLADGTLSLQERRAITNYENDVFDEGWHLRPDAAPEFIPSDNDAIGAVSEP